jgi:ketosteroid isomerase-like protein
MSEPAPGDSNLELLREGFEAYNRGELGFVMERAAGDIEVHADVGLVNSGTYHGRGPFERWMLEWQEAWSEITLEVRGVEEIGDFILVDIYQRAVGAGSGVPVEMEIVQLFEIRDGAIARFHLYRDRERARAALRELGVDVRA